MDAYQLRLYGSTHPIPAIFHVFRSRTRRTAEKHAAKLIKHLALSGYTKAYLSEWRDFDREIPFAEYKIGVSILIEVDNPGEQAMLEVFGLKD